MLTWTQIYTPVAGNLLLSALVAALPVVVLLGLLAFFHVKAHKAALLGLATSLGVAIFVYGMPTKLALTVGRERGGLRPLPDRLDRPLRDLRLRPHREVG